MQFGTFTELLAAVAAFASALIALWAAKIAREGVRLQVEFAKHERANRAFEQLVREPMLRQISAAAKACCDAVETAHSNLSASTGFDSEGMREAILRNSLEKIQRSLLELRTDLSVIAVGANEIDLWERLRRFLGDVEDQVLLEVENMRADETNLRCRRNVRLQFARVQRAVVDHGAAGHPVPRVLPPV